jgi:hypothetical protein
VWLVTVCTRYTTAELSSSAPLDSSDELFCRSLATLKRFSRAHTRKPCFASRRCCSYVAYERGETALGCDRTITPFSISPRRVHGRPELSTCTIHVICDPFRARCAASS